MNSMSTPTPLIQVEQMDSLAILYNNHEDKSSNSTEIYSQEFVNPSSCIEPENYPASYEISPSFIKNESSHLEPEDQASMDNQIAFLLTSVTCPSTGFFEYFSNYSYPQSLSLNFLTSINFFSSTSEISHENLFIFDWDDTLLPSTWLSLSKVKHGGAHNLSVEDENALIEMATVAHETLKLASELGQVVIVTNAEEGWIELSCQRFLPTLFNFLSQFKMISARSVYNGEPIFNPSLWKQQSFINVVKDFYNNRSCPRTPNIISIGDSLHERSALINCQKELGELGFQPKSIKLMEQPDILELKKEHEVLQASFVDLINFDGVLDLILFDLFDTFYQTVSEDQLPRGPLNTNFNILTRPIDCPPNTTSAQVSTSTDLLISVENYS